MMKYKEVSFELKGYSIIYDCITTHTPVPAGNDIFPLSLVEKYFDGFLGKTRTFKRRIF